MTYFKDATTRINARRDPRSGTCSRGWVSALTKPEAVGCHPSDHSYCLSSSEVTEGPNDRDIVSLPTPLEGTAFRDIRDNGI